jgi:uncharacterized membrane protein YfcA
MSWPFSFTGPGRAAVTGETRGHMDWRASLVGLVVGWTIGVSGVGAGTLTLPLLVLWLGVPPLTAVGSNVVHSAVTTVVGGWQHTTLRTVDFGIVARMAVGSVPASLVAAWWISSLDNDLATHDLMVDRVIGSALIAAALILAGRGFMKHRDAAPQGRPRGWLLGSAGALLGGAVGATSVGSGSFGTAIIAVATRLQGPKIVGTVTVHAMLLTLASASTHLMIGTVRPALVGALLLGSIPGVVLGSRLTARMPEALLRGALALLLLGIGIRMQVPRRPPVGPSAVPVRAPDGPGGVESVDPPLFDLSSQRKDTPCHT